MKKVLGILVCVLALSCVLTACNFFNKTSKVTFDTQGGNLVSTQTVLSGEKAIEPKDPVYEGKEFVGWSTNKTTYVKFDFNTAISEDTTVYAIWRDLTAEELFNSALDKMSNQNYLNVISYSFAIEQALVFHKGNLVSSYTKEKIGLDDDDFIEKWENKNGVFVRESNGTYFKDSNNLLGNLTIRDFFLRNIDTDKVTYSFGDNNEIIIEYDDVPFIEITLEGGLVKTIKILDVDHPNEMFFTYVKNDKYYAPEGWTETILSAEEMFSYVLDNMSQQDYMNLTATFTNGNIQALVYEKGNLVSVYTKYPDGSEEWINEAGKFIKSLSKNTKEATNLDNYPPTIEEAFSEFYGMEFSYGLDSNEIIISTKKGPYTKVTLENELIIKMSLLFIEGTPETDEISLSYEKNQDFYVPDDINWEEETAEQAFTNAVNHMSQQDYVNLTATANGITLTLVYEKDNLVSIHNKFPDGSEEWINEAGKFIKGLNGNTREDATFGVYAPTIKELFSVFYGNEFSYGLDSNEIIISEDGEPYMKIVLKNKLIMEMFVKISFEEVGIYYCSYEKNQDFYVPDGIDWEEKILTAEQTFDNVLNHMSQQDYVNFTSTFTSGNTQALVYEKGNLVSVYTKYWDESEEWINKYGKFIKNSSGNTKEAFNLYIYPPFIREVFSEFYGMEFSYGLDFNEIIISTEKGPYIKVVLENELIMKMSLLYTEGSSETDGIYFTYEKNPVYYVPDDIDWSEN